ncbi:MAG TPA: tripartite tricarboxylate transporter substrate binding protein [Xanthobacteraceae bacterium]
MIDRRRCLELVAASALAPLFGAAPARAQPIIFPDRVVRLVVPFAPAGGADVIGRLMAARLSEMWGQQVVVENRSGAGGNIAAEMVAHAEPDGYTLFLPSLGHAINRFLFPSLAYDPVADFAPISLVCTYPNIMVVPLSSPARTVQEFIDHARANPGRITFASSSLGTSVHLAGELFKRMAHIEMTHIPYRGAGPAYNDVIPGRIDVMFATASSALPQIEGGKLRGLGVTALARQAWAPDLPTIAESGLPGFEVSSWYGLFAPARTPPEIVGKISADAAAVAHEPAFVAQLDRIATTAVGSTPEELGRHLKSEMDKWGPIITEARIRVEE